MLWLFGVGTGLVSEFITWIVPLAKMKIKSNSVYGIISFVALFLHPRMIPLDEIPDNSAKETWELLGWFNKGPLFLISPRSASTNLSFRLKKQWIMQQVLGEDHFWLFPH